MVLLDGQLFLDWHPKLYAAVPQVFATYEHGTSDAVQIKSNRGNLITQLKETLAYIEVWPASCLTGIVTLCSSAGLVSCVELSSLLSLLLFFLRYCLIWTGLQSAKVRLRSKSNLLGRRVFVNAICVAILSACMYFVYWLTKV